MLPKEAPKGFSPGCERAGKSPILPFLHATSSYLLPFECILLLSLLVSKVVRSARDSLPTSRSGLSTIDGGVKDWMRPVSHP